MEVPRSEVNGLTSVRSWPRVLVLEKLTKRRADERVCAGLLLRAKVRSRGRAACVRRSVWARLHLEQRVAFVRTLADQRTPHRLRWANWFDHLMVAK